MGSTIPVLQMKKPWPKTNLLLSWKQIVQEKTQAKHILSTSTLEYRPTLGVLRIQASLGIGRHLNVSTSYAHMNKIKIKKNINDAWLGAHGQSCHLKLHLSFCS
jgi:hypothetical protein